MENIDDIIKKLCGRFFFFAYKKLPEYYDFSYGGVNYESKNYFGLFGM